MNSYLKCIVPKRYIYFCMFSKHVHVMNWTHFRVHCTSIKIKRSLLLETKFSQIHTCTCELMGLREGNVNSTLVLFSGDYRKYCGIKVVVVVVVVVVLGLLACHSKRIFPPEYKTEWSWEMLKCIFLSISLSLLICFLVVSSQTLS